MKTSKRADENRKPGTFDVEAFLNSAGCGENHEGVRENDTLFSQGDPCKNIMTFKKAR